MVFDMMCFNAIISYLRIKIILARQKVIKASESLYYAMVKPNNKFC